MSYSIKFYGFLQLNKIDVNALNMINWLHKNRHTDDDYPSIWCDWKVNKLGRISWDGNENSYVMDKWIKFIIDNILSKSNIKVNGKVYYTGEDKNDFGIIIVNNNDIEVHGNIKCSGSGITADYTLSNTDIADFENNQTNLELYSTLINS